ncbi:MAG TPA: ribosome-associated translation inhibitor RaiA [Opitutaceae bacterium]|jgi:putative sigma-54 modulation protein|nr:ribosome-associated translation inhibitor RaiA [Opitutaceae bacterium]
MNQSLQGADPRIRFQGVHIELTESLQAAIYEKFGSLLRHNEHIVAIDVRLQKAQTLGHDALFTASGKITLRGPDLVAHAEGKEGYGVLEAVAAKLDRLLEKRHGLRKEKRNHPHPAEVGGALPKVE